MRGRRVRLVSQGRSILTQACLLGPAPACKCRVAVQPQLKPEQPSDLCSPYLESQPLPQSAALGFPGHRIISKGRGKRGRAAGLAPLCCSIFTSFHIDREAQILITSPRCPAKEPPESPSHKKTVFTVIVLTLSLCCSLPHSKFTKLQ